MRKEASPEARLEGFLAKYTPEIAALARDARTRLRARLPGASELVYDNYNALVIAFGPTDRASSAILSIALYPRWVTLFFANGATLPDPRKLLQGSGTRVRSIVLEKAEDVDKPAVRALIKHAVADASQPLGSAGPPQLIIKSVSKKQRPRRPR